MYLLELGWESQNSKQINKQTTKLHPATLSTGSHSVKRPPVQTLLFLSLLCSCISPYNAFPTNHARHFWGILLFLHQSEPLCPSWLRGSFPKSLCPEAFFLRGILLVLSQRQKEPRTTYLPILEATPCILLALLLWKASTLPSLSLPKSKIKFFKMITWNKCLLNSSGQHLSWALRWEIVLAIASRGCFVFPGELNIRQNYLVLGSPRQPRASDPQLEPPSPK